MESSFSPPKGIHCFSTGDGRSKTVWLYGGVSVPRRGFIVFLLFAVFLVLTTRVWYEEFQSPEGDSLFFYELGLDEIRAVYEAFQSPEGDSLFFYTLLVAALVGTGA